MAEKILRFARAALAAAWMRGKSYLSVGSVSMGIAGSIVDPDFFQNYLGMRNEYVDMSEMARRLEEKIYSEAEYRRALEWVKDEVRRGPGQQRSPGPASAGAKRTRPGRPASRWR